MLVDRILLIQVDFEELAMLVALEILVPAVDVRVRFRATPRFVSGQTYEFSFLKLAWIKSSSVTSMKSSLSETGIKYRLLSSGP